MRIWSALIVLAISFSLCTAVTLAAPKERKKERPSAEEMFKKLDKNSDGKLSKEEFVEGKKDKDKAEGYFKKLDKNGDDALSLEEFKAMSERKGKKKEDKQ